MILSTRIALAARICRPLVFVDNWSSAFEPRKAAILSALAPLGCGIPSRICSGFRNAEFAEVMEGNAGLGTKGEPNCVVQEACFLCEIFLYHIS